MEAKTMPTREHRIWDDYLSEADREHVRATQRQAWGFGAKPALLMVDLYRWVFGTEPQPLMQAVAQWPASCGLVGWEALPKIQQLLGAARDTGIPVIHVTGLPERDSGIRSWASTDTNTNASRRSLLDDIEPTGMYDIIPEVAPVEGEVFLRKNASSVFWGTPITAHLTMLGVDTLIVAGESTSGCVRASVVDGCTNGYRMIVAEECVFDRHEATHAINLFDMHQKYADVLALAEILKWLSHRE